MITPCPVCGGNCPSHELVLTADHLQAGKRIVDILTASGAWDASDPAIVFAVALLLVEHLATKFGLASAAPVLMALTRQFQSIELARRAAAEGN